MSHTRDHRSDKEIYDELCGLAEMHQRHPDLVIVAKRVQYLREELRLRSKT